MSTDEERLVSISAEWRTKVVAILRSGDKNSIQSTATSDTDWRAAFPNSWKYERHEAFAAALSEDIKGRHIKDMQPPCDAYEFLFAFEKRTVLGKIGLLPDGTIIIIFSSHIPRKGDLL